MIELIVVGVVVGGSSYLLNRYFRRIGSSAPWLVYVFIGLCVALFVGFVAFYLVHPLWLLPRWA
jgi:hypothetical protein